MIKKFITLVFTSLLLISCGEDENNNAFNCQLTAFSPIPECVTNSFTEVFPFDMPEESNSSIGCDCNGKSSGDFIIDFFNPSFDTLDGKSFGSVSESRQSLTLFEFIWEIEDCSTISITEFFNGEGFLGTLEFIKVPEERVLEFFKHEDGGPLENIICSCTQFLFCLDE